MAVSLPAKELTAVQLPGSLYASDRLVTASLSPELRAALQQIEALSTQTGQAPVFIARPELFTDGETLAWLGNKLGPIRDHLCVSDGTTIRLIPGMRNHVFFYALGRRGDSDALGRLERRVPELFSTLASQVNSALRIRHRNSIHAPPTVILHHRVADEFDVPTFRRFYFNRHSTEDSVARMLHSVTDEIATAKLSRLVYVPLTESATCDPHFMHLLAVRIERSHFDPATGIILGLPYAQGADASLAARLHGFFVGLQSVANQIPRVVADNILVATDDIDPRSMRSLADEFDLLVHDTFDFWRWTKSCYDVFDKIEVMVQRGRHQPAALTALLQQAYGAKAALVRHRFTG